MSYPIIAVAQLQQMALVNWQLHEQRAIAHWQSNLAQVLHETEQTARRVDATSPHDMVASSILARAWLIRIAGVDARHFNDIHSKRGWSEAFDCLRRYADAGDRETNDYFARMDKLSSYQRHMAPLDEMTAEASARHRKRKASDEAERATPPPPAIELERKGAKRKRSA